MVNAMIVARGGRADRLEATLRMSWPGGTFERLTDAEAADRRARRGRCCLVVADLALVQESAGRGAPGALRVLREATAAPLIVLVRDEEDAESFYARGGRAEDYLVEPFTPVDLLARAHAALRRGPTGGRPFAERAAEWSAEGDALASFDDGYLAIDFGWRRVQVRREPVLLTAGEFDLLADLAREPDRVVPSETLLTRWWGDGHREATAFLWCFIRRLREKLEPNPDAPRYLVTERGVGYRLVRPRTPQLLQWPRLAGAGSRPDEETGPLGWPDGGAPCRLPRRPERAPVSTPRPHPVVAGAAIHRLVVAR
jgi:DNA-binding response OmpR family regulator